MISDFTDWTLIVLWFDVGPGRSIGIALDIGMVSAGG